MRRGQLRDAIDFTRSIIDEVEAIDQARQFAEDVLRSIAGGIAPVGDAKDAIRVLDAGTSDCHRCGKPLGRIVAYGCVGSHDRCPS